MKMTFRWYGDNDPVTLGQIRQIPGVTGIVSVSYTHLDVYKRQVLRTAAGGGGLPFPGAGSGVVHADVYAGILACSPSPAGAAADLCIQPDQQGNEEP